MNNPFQKATKSQRFFKGCLFGVSGSGKTWTSLAIMRDLVGKDGRIAVIDTERSSASLYADHAEFDVVSLTDFSVNGYINMIEAATTAGYTGLIIDGLSQAWEGTKGLLERVQEIARVKGYGNKMLAWNDVKPEENRLWDAILDAPLHTIITMRSKTKYEISKNDDGKTSVDKLGLAPIQRADKEYEFDVVGRMETDNTLVVTKSRCSGLSNKAFPRPGKNVSKILIKWLTSGEAMKPPTKPDAQEPHDSRTDALPSPPSPEETEQVDLRAKVKAWFKSEGMTWKDFVKEYGDLREWPIEQLRSFAVSITTMPPASSGPTDEEKAAAIAEETKEAEKDERYKQMGIMACHKQAIPATDADMQAMAESCVGKRDPADMNVGELIKFNEFLKTAEAQAMERKENAK